MKKIAIIGALPEELESLRSLGTNIHTHRSGPFEFQTFNNGKIECLLSLSGIGKVQAAMLVQHIIDTWNPQAFIFTGVAGALNNDYDIGDVVIGAEFIQHDLDVRPLGFARGEIPYTGEKIFSADQNLVKIANQFLTDKHKLFTGRILTGDQFITHSHMEDYFTEEFGGDAIEMEGAALALVATRNQVPYLVIRTISDRADGNAAVDFDTLLPRVAKNSSSIVEFILKEIQKTSSDLEQRYFAVKEDIADYAKSQKREDQVQLLTVTKNHSVEKIQCLYDLGVKNFAENRVQELKDKAALLPDDIHWHLIGPLQSNKVRQAIAVAKTIHSVDNLALAQRIDRIAGEDNKKIDIFIQLNLTGEIQKSGISALSLEKLLIACSQLENIRLVGLMTMGPLSATEEENIRVFNELKELLEQHESLFAEKPKLSMGMSADFKEAIQCGSNIVRVGSAIMGDRVYETH